MTTQNSQAVEAAVQQPEALRLAAWLNEGAWHQMKLGDVEAAGRELRRLHNETVALRAELTSQQEVAEGEELRQRHLDLLQDVLDAKDVMRAAGIGQCDFPTMFKEFAASRSAGVAGGVDASRGQDSFHVANAESGPVQASDSRAYTDAQLTAGVEALGICRGMGIPLSDETVAGVVYDYMTAAGPKRPLTIYMDEDPIDVEQFYRAKGFEKLPATPTMTGQEIRDCGWKKQHDNQMFIDHGNTGKQFQPIGTTEAVILVNGMRFVSIPAATWGGGR